MNPDAHWSNAVYQGLGNSLLGPPSSIAGSPEKTTFSVDLGWIFVDIAYLKSCHINFLLMVMRFTSVDNSWADRAAICSPRTFFCW